MTKGRRYTKYIFMPIAYIIKERRKTSKFKSFPMFYFYLRGFLSSTQAMLNINSRNYKNYLTDWHEMKTGEINGQAAYYLNNKIEFADMIKDYIKVPESLAVVNKNKFHSLSTKLEDLSDLMTYLEVHTRIVHKPIFGSEGRGVSIIKVEDNQILKNGLAISLQALEDYIMTSENFFLSEFINQSDFGNQLYPDSLNTMRILTMVDPLTEKSFIAAGMQRVGTQSSAPTDNFSQRAVAFNINLESGMLEEGIYMPTDTEITRPEAHPDTQNPLTGLHIPNWTVLKEDLISLCDYIYQAYDIKYVGWDIVHTEDGFEVLEGNSWPGIDFHQLYGPFLIDGQIRTFYDYHGIL